MKFLFYSCLLAAFIFMPYSSFADDNTDSTETNKSNYQFDTRDFYFIPSKPLDIYHYFFGKRLPRIDISYDINNISIDKKEFQGKFNNTPDIEIKAGYITNTNVKRGILIKSNYDYLTIAHYNPKLGTDKDTGQYPAVVGAEPYYTNFEGWKFGYGDYKGYGWKISDNFCIVLSHGGNLNWHILRFNEQESDFEFKNKLDRFHDKLKFGSSFEAGINLTLFNNLGLNATYEQDHIFPAHLFWYWTGSELIENIAKEFTNSFIQEITKRNMIAGPIINFVVKNGISYGMYELRKSKMNWPFSHEAPLVLEKFKLGISYTF